MTTADRIQIFHVDDESRLTDVVATFLEHESDRFEVRSAHSPEEGRKALSEFDIDCVVSDYEMPTENGIEFLESVRRTHPELPFILFTGKDYEVISENTFPAQVTGYLQKTTGTEQYAVLASLIQNAVERTAVDRERDRAFERIQPV